MDWSLSMGHLCNFQINLHVTAQCTFRAGGAQLLPTFLDNFWICFMVNLIET